MVRRKATKMHEESKRAPSGVCEITIQAAGRDARKYNADISDAMRDYTGNSHEVKTFLYDDEESIKDRVVIFTGTDRLDIATLRDIAEVYGVATEYEGGNIPPNLTLVPTSNQNDKERMFIWLEFKLQVEKPKGEVEKEVKSEGSEMELVPKNPIGDDTEAIVFRNGNVAHHQVRSILRTCNNIRDALPVSYIRLICDTKMGDEQ